MRFVSGLVAKLSGNGVGRLRTDLAAEIDANIAALQKGEQLRTAAWGALQKKDDIDLENLRERVRPAYDAIAVYQSALRAYYEAAGANDPRINGFAQVVSSKGEELMHTMRTVRGLLNG